MKSCGGSCKQGRSECDCSGDAPELFVTFFCGLGIVIAVALLALGVL